MYCPQCLTAYRDGFTKCADCRIPLRAGDPVEPREHPSVELVTVLEAHDSFALSLAKASLEDAGIEYLVSEEDPGYLPGFHGASGIGATPLWKCSSRIQVAREFEGAARALLEPLQSESADQSEPKSRPGSE